MIGAARAGTTEELRTELIYLINKDDAANAKGTFQGSFYVVYVNPLTIPPAALKGLLAEFTDDINLLTPAQAARAKIENDTAQAWLDAKQQVGKNNPVRDNATLRVSTPSTTLVAPTAADAIPIAVRITGQAGVLLARVSYVTPSGQLGVADLQPTADKTLWTATLPPTLSGGNLVVSARVVEDGGMTRDGNTVDFWGYGIAISNELTLTIPKVDRTQCGADDTMKWYLGLNLDTWNTWGDGLPDGYNPTPYHARKDQLTLLAPIYPPADNPFLADACASTTDTA